MSIERFSQNPFSNPETFYLRDNGFAFGCYMPRKPITNQEIEMMKLTDSGGRLYTSESITKSTGMRNRFHEPNLNSYEMAKAAIIGKFNDLTSPDLVLFSSSYPLAFNQAEALSLDLGLDPLDVKEINAACTGFTVGISYIKDNERELNGKRVLFIASEKYSETCDFSTKFQQSDGAIGMMFTYGEDLTVVGNGAKFYQKSDDVRLPQRFDNTNDPNTIFLDIPKSDNFYYQDGRKVLESISSIIPQLIIDAVQNAGLDLSQIKMIIPQQSGKQALKALSKRLENCTFAVDYYDGYMSSASIPRTFMKAVNGGLRKFYRKGEEKDGKLGIGYGDYVVLAGYGAGFYADIKVIKVG